MPEAVEQQTAGGADDPGQVFTQAGQAAVASQQAPAAASAAATSSAAGAAQPATGATSQQVTDALEAAKALGIDVTKFRSPAELVQRMYEALNDSRQYADIGRRYAPHAQRIDSYLAQPSPQAQPAAAAAKPADEWDEEKYWNELPGPPKAEATWQNALALGVVARDENGAFAPKSPEWAPIAHQMNDYLLKVKAWETQQQNANPHRSAWDAIRPVAERHFGKILDERVKTAFAEYQQERQFDEWRNWLDQYSYEQDPITKQWKTNAWRQQFDAELDALEGDFPNADPQAILQRALRAVGNPGSAATATSPTSAAAATSVADVNEKRKQDFLAGAQQLQQQTLGGAGVATSAEALPPTTEAEMANLFVNDIARFAAGQR